MRKRKSVFIILFAVAVMAFHFSWGQPVSYTSEHPVNLLYSYKKSLNLPNNNLLVIYGRNSWGHYSCHLNLSIHDKYGKIIVQNIVSVQKNGFNLYYKDAFIFKKNIYVLCFNRIGKTSEFNYVLLKLNTETLTLEVEKNVQFNNLPAEWVTDGEYRLCYSPDSSLIGIFTVSSMKSDFTKSVFVDVIGSNIPGVLSTKYVCSISSVENTNTLQVKDMALLNSGDVIMLVKYYTHPGTEVIEGKPGYHYVLQKYILGKLQKTLNVTPDSNLMRDAVICPLKTGEKILVASYECDMGLNAPTGMWLYQADSGLLGPGKTSFIKWPEETDTTLRGHGSFKIFIDNQPPYFIFFDNQKLFDVMGARITHTFNTYRGKLISLETDSLLKKEKVEELNKYQLLEDISDKPFVFDRKNYTIYYIQNESYHGAETLSTFNVQDGKTAMLTLDNQYWSPKKYYDILIDDSYLTLVEPQGRKYVIIKYRLP